MLGQTTGSGGEWEKIPLILIGTRFSSLNSPFAQSLLIFESADNQHNGAVLLPAAGALGYHWSKQSVLLPLQLIFFSPLSVSAKQVKKQLSENSFLNFVSVELCSSLYSCLHWIQWITLYAPYVAIAQIRIIRREIAVAMHISGKETHQWLQINSELGSVILPSPLCRATQRAGWDMGGDGVRCTVQPLLEEISGFCGNLPNTRSTDSASVCASLQHYTVLTLTLCKPLQPP